MKFLICICLFITYSKGLSSYGPDYYVGGLRNIAGLTSNLYLYIITHSSIPVGVTVEGYDGVMIANGNITDATLMKLTLSKSLAAVSDDYDNRHKGIRVYTDGGMVSVILFNYQYKSLGVYLAYPLVYLDLHQYYKYYAVSTSTTTIGPSEILVIGTGDDTTVTVIPTKDIAVPQNIQLSSSPEINITAGTSYTFPLHRLQSFLILAPPHQDLTGTSITSDKPLSVISGHQCGNVPDTSVFGCQHITVQIPPTVEWGKQFLLSPYIGQPVQYYKVIAMEGQTILNVTCDNDNVTTVSLSGGGDSHTHSTDEIDNYCSIISNKPILVNQLGSSHGDGNIGNSVISYIPPIHQFTTTTAYVSLNVQNVFRLNYINIVATSQDTVLLDGTPLSLDWNDIYDGTDNVIGYGAQVQVNTTDIPHAITTASGNTKFYLLVYGYGSWQIIEYSYSIGFNTTTSDTDIDECYINNGECNQYCINTVGSYRCHCGMGYSLNDDRHNCTDIDECSINNGGCEQECHNTNGSYHCSCYAGYNATSFNGSMVRCLDINECEYHNGGCEQVCINTPGSFHCSCFSGFSLYNNVFCAVSVNEMYYGVPIAVIITAAVMSMVAALVIVIIVKRMKKKQIFTPYQQLDVDFEEMSSLSRSNETSHNDNDQDNGDDDVHQSLELVETPTTQ